MASMAGALILTLVLIVGLLELPSLLPLQPVPPPEGSIPTPTFLSNEVTQRASPPPLNNPGLIQSIYSGQIAYIAPRIEGDDLFIMQSDGSRVSDLGFGDTIKSYPAWSPDGSQIAYLSTPPLYGVSTPDGNSPNEVWVINADRSNPRPVSPRDLALSTDFQGINPTQARVDYPNFGPPRWSPDGKYLAVTGRSSSKTAFLGLISTSGGLARYLPVEAPDAQLIQWSPDGSTIAYIDQMKVGIWLWKPESPEIQGENPQFIRDSVGWDMIFGMAWSPDSSSIAILVGSRPDSLVNVTLRKYNRVSGKLEGYIPIFSGNLDLESTKNSSLAWSPDGRYLAFIPVFSDIHLGNRQILLVRADGSGLLPLVVLERGVGDFTWSPDGRWIAFSSGGEVWAASLEAFEASQNYLVRISFAAGFGLSWQPARCKLKVCL